MSEQPELDFRAAPPVPTDPEVSRLIDWLLAHPGFHTAAAIAAALSLTDRKVRQLAEHSDGLIVSGPGSPGYCHFQHCPAKVIGHIADTLRSQANSMLARSIRLRLRAHHAIH